MNVKQLLAWNRHYIWNLSDCNGTWTYNHLDRQRTLNHCVRLRTKCLWVRAPLQSVKTGHISMMIHEFKRSIKCRINSSTNVQIGQSNQDVIRSISETPLMPRKEENWEFFRNIRQRELDKSSKFREEVWEGDSVAFLIGFAVGFCNNNTNNRSALLFKK